MVETIANAATSVSEVRAIEKLKVRKVGPQYAVDLHVQAEPQMSLADVAGRCRWQMSLADVAAGCARSERKGEGPNSGRDAGGGCGA